MLVFPALPWVAQAGGKEVGDDLHAAVCNNAERTSGVA